MRALLQRVTRASVSVSGQERGSIHLGLVVLLGIGREDQEATAQRLLRKILALRIFDDEEGRMNRSVQDVSGGLLVVSQFTLYADTQKGNRPSYLSAAPPEVAVPLYEHFLELAREECSGPVAEGEFGADMQVELVNSGPVTIWLES